MFEFVKVTTGAARVLGRKLTRLNGLVLLAACAISLLGLDPARATTATTTGILGFTSPSVFGQSVNFVAVVGPTGATGTVSFFDGANLIGTSPLDAATGIASFNISTLAVGPHGISATYNGDANFSASTSSTLSQTVNQALTNTVVNNTPNPSVFGQPVTITATVTAIGAGSGTPTGLVTFLFDGSSIGTANLSQGVATFTTSALAIGTHGIQATYAGDTNFLGSFNGGPDQTINKAGTTTAVISSANPVSIGNPVTLTATVSPVAPGGGTPTGTVTFKDGTGPLGVGTLVGGVATITVNYVIIGNSTVTTNYAGDTNFSGSTGSLTGNPQVISPAGTTTALVSSQNPSTFNQAVTFTATVTRTGGPGTPTGTVTFKDGATTLGTGTLASGVASFTTSTLTPGSHSLTATYGGDTVFTGSSGSVTQSVGTIGTNTALASTPNPSFAGQAVTFTATVTKSGGAGTPTGTVTFKDGGSTLGTGTLNGAGVASLATSALATGSHSVSAVYGGDANFSVSTSAALTQAVNLPADSIKLRALQIQATKLEAQGSGQAVAGTIDSAISEGFAQTGTPISASDNGVRFNFSADPQPQEKEKTFEERSGGAFTALGYGEPVKAPPPRPAPREWLFWADVRGTDWSTNQQTGDIRGGQTNGFLGLTHKLSPDFLVGAFGGMEVFNYSSQQLAGHLKGNGWTSGGYLALRLLPGLRLDLGGSYSGIGYDGLAGTASGSFQGQRWLATAALVGTIKTAPGFELESSARAYGLWERENAYTDSLGTAQAERNFSTGRASAGTKISYPWMASGMTIAPMWAPMRTITSTRTTPRCRSPHRSCFPPHSFTAGPRA